MCITGASNKVMHDLNDFIGKNISRMIFLPLKEETNNNYINPGQLLHGMQCARCERTLVKSSKAEHYNKVFDTIFNSRKPVMCCEELLTEWPRECSFFICDDCKGRLIGYDSNETNNGTPSRPKRNKRGN